MELIGKVFPLASTELGQVPEDRQAKTRPDKTRQDKTRQEKTRHDKTRTRQDKTRQDKTKQNRCVNRTVPCSIGYCYTIVTLLSHCCHTVVTLLSHCCHTVITLLLHCSYTVLNLLHCCVYRAEPGSRGWGTPAPLPAQWSSTHTPLVHCLVYLFM
jgi:hypothetical protein